MKKALAVLLSVLMIMSSCMCMASALFTKKEGILRLIVPESWEMDIGDSRTVDCAVKDTTNFVTWSAEPADIAKVDPYGRVTALKEGEAVITAQNAEGYTDSVTLKVVKEATKSEVSLTKKDYKGEAVAENKVLQKIVTRYSYEEGAVPKKFYNEANYPDAQTVTTKDGAVWTITNYGVLRVDEKAADSRDKEMRFMGDRYFYSPDTGDGKVLAIFADGENGIWTVMKEGFTHIEMLPINGTDKAAMMSATTQEYVARRGMVSEAYLHGDEWIPAESDNDGLWTAMYGGGELMRYAVLRDDPTATKEEIEAARKTAYLSAEAVLLLTYISMRKGTTEAFVRHQRHGSITDYDTGKYYSKEVLIKGGDFSQSVPFESPATMFDRMNAKYLWTGIPSYTQNDDNLAVGDPESWVDPSDANAAKREKLIEGFWARTYTLKSEKEAGYSNYDGYIYWSHNGDGTATGMSTKKNSDGTDMLLNNENLRGYKVDASGEIPQRLWDDLLGSKSELKDMGISIDDIVYKGDTSADEVIGHLFIYKLAYDILGPEDPEIKAIIETTMDKFAQHIVDNGYNLVDGSGQPTTWGKYNRTYLHNGQVLGGAALQTSVILSAFKLAHYVTGDKKWDDEYRMAALDEQYQYAKIMTQNRERYRFAILEFANSVSPVLGFILRPLIKTTLVDTVYRIILNYSDEEMAMLAYYLLFQMEDDETLLQCYREGIDDWWFSMSFSENPLWYYVYQLAYPEKEIKDQYGNNIVETAAWQLSRHPIDTRIYLASNENRDDIDEFNLAEAGIGDTEVLSFDPNHKKPFFYDSDNQILKLIGMVLAAATGRLKWKVAAADERGLHKYNGSSYTLSNHEPYCMEGSTTYTLPYWMGRYHGLLK